jgi:hypothetical protein
MLSDLDKFARTALDGTFEGALLASRQLRALVRDEGKRRRLLTYDNICRAIIQIGKHDHDDIHRDLAYALYVVAKVAPDKFDNFANVHQGLYVLAALLRSTDAQAAMHAARAVTFLCEQNTSLISPIVSQGCLLPLVGVMKSARLPAKTRVSAVRALGQMAQGQIPIRMLAIWAVTPALELLRNCADCEQSVRFEIAMACYAWCCSEKMVLTMTDVCKTAVHELLQAATTDPDVAVRSKVLRACAELTSYRRGVRAMLSADADHVILFETAVRTTPSDPDFDVRHAFVLMLENCLSLRPATFHDIITDEKFFDVERIVFSNMSTALALAVLRSSASTPTVTRLVIGCLKQVWSSLCHSAASFEKSSIVSGLLHALRRAATRQTRLHVVQAFERMMAADSDFVTKCVKLEGFQTMLSQLSPRSSPHMRYTALLCLMHMAPLVPLDSVPAGSLLPILHMLEEGIQVFHGQSRTTGFGASTYFSSFKKEKLKDNEVEKWGVPSAMQQSDDDEIGVDSDIDSDDDDDDASVSLTSTQEREQHWSLCIRVGLEVCLRLAALGTDMRTRLISRGVVSMTIALVRQFDRAVLLLSILVEEKVSLSSFDMAFLLSVVDERVRQGNIAQSIAIPLLRIIQYLGEPALHVSIQCFVDEWNVIQNGGCPVYASKSVSESAQQVDASMMASSANLFSPSVFRKELFKCIVPFADREPVATACGVIPIRWFFLTPDPSLAGICLAVLDRAERDADLCKNVESVAGTTVPSLRATMQQKLLRTISPSRPRTALPYTPSPMIRDSSLLASTRSLPATRSGISPLSRSRPQSAVAAKQASPPRVRPASAAVRPSASASPSHLSPASTPFTPPARPSSAKVSTGPLRPSSAKVATGPLRPTSAKVSSGTVGRPSSAKPSTSPASARQNFLRSPSATKL